MKIAGMLDWFRNQPLNVKLGIVGATIGTILAGASVYLYGWDAWQAKAKTPASGVATDCNCQLPAATATFRVNAFHMIVLCLWIIVPPVWFACETYLVSLDYDKAKLRNSQELFSRIWVGVSVMLTVLASVSK